MKAKIVYASLSAIIPSILIFFAVAGCAKPEVGSLDQNRRVAEEFVKMDSTFRFDGIPNTFNLAVTTSVANGWKFDIKFDSEHSGYGNRTGKSLVEVTTPHVAVVTVQAGKVASAIMDGSWDMITHRELE